jgi:hypothetical protein
MDLTQAGLEIVIFLPPPPNTGIIDVCCCTWLKKMFVLAVLGFQLRTCACQGGCLSVDPTSALFAFRLFFSNRILMLFAQTNHRSQGL